MANVIYYVLANGLTDGMWLPSRVHVITRHQAVQEWHFALPDQANAYNISQLTIIQQKRHGYIKMLNFVGLPILITCFISFYANKCYRYN